MLLLKAMIFWDFPRGPVVKLRLHASNAAGSMPGWGTKIPYAMQHSPKEKKKKKSHIFQLKAAQWHMSHPLYLPNSTPLVITTNF